ncbi:MAG: DUF4139 domain-containing protein [Bacteroidia bacterium]|nr:DUF4139 domain-containing protein [Bacteroidia bacterium]MDW8089013.1 hypothetical protein [Bacteroidia bacterium]
MAKLWGGVIAWGWAQMLLPLTRLTYYSSGRVVWLREAMLPMPHAVAVARLPATRYPFYPLPQPEYRIRNWHYVPDTLQGPPIELPTTLSDFLRAHIGGPVWLLYEAGKEWEETNGTLEMVNTRGDVLLRRPNQERLWVPGELLRLARVEGNAPAQCVYPAWRLTVETDTALSLGRLSVMGWDSLAPWRARHLMRLIGPTRLALTTWIELPPLNENAYPVELYIIQTESDSSVGFSWHLPMQRFVIGAAKRLTLLQAELPYTEVYRVSLPDLVESLEPFQLTSWKGTAERSLQVLNTEKITLPSGAVDILDEAGNILTQSYLPTVPPLASGYLPLASTPNLQIRAQESEVRREKVKEPLLGHKVWLAGSLRIQNGTNREIRLILEKRITGVPLSERLGFARATRLPERRGTNLCHLLSWEILLRPGSVETLEYAYEIFLPSR